jgi:uncharacterized membrane protein YfcA
MAKDCAGEAVRMVEKVLAALILCFGAAYAAANIARSARRRAETRAEPGSPLLLAPLEGAVFFLSALGFPDFVLGTLFYRKLGLVDDRRLPGTLVAATIVPGSLIAAIYLLHGGADAYTVLLCAAAEAAGSAVGARAVSKLGGEQIRRRLGFLLAAAVAVLIVKSAVFPDAGGAGRGLSGAAFAIALPVLFALGAVNMIGFPMKPSSLLLLLLLGMSPVAALTVVMTMGAVGTVAGGAQVMRGELYQKKIALYASTAGLAGAALGSVFAFSINGAAFTWILIAMMCFTAASLLKKNIAK